MPTYDYTCLDCNKRFDIFLTYEEYGKRPAACPHCKSLNTRRRVNRIRMLKSDEARMQAIADPSTLAGLDDDPQALGQVMRKMGAEMGEDLPPEFNEVVDRLEAGQSPNEIESALPDLGLDSGGGMADDF